MAIKLCEKSKDAKMRYILRISFAIGRVYSRCYCFVLRWQQAWLSEVLTATWLSWVPQCGLYPKGKHHRLIWLLLIAETWINWSWQATINCGRTLLSVLKWSYCKIRVNVKMKTLKRKLLAILREAWKNQTAVILLNLTKSKASITNTWLVYLENRQQT